MPVRWNVLAVSKALDELEGLLKEAEPALRQLQDKARETQRIPNLAGYVSEPFGMLSQDVNDTLHKFQHRIKRIRENLPNGDLQKAQGRYEKWLGYFGGDEEKAEQALRLFQ